MSRRKQAKPRKLIPDPVYASASVAQLINMVMEDGKKFTARKIVYSALVTSAERLSEQPANILEKVLENIMPRLEVKARRAGGVTLQIPTELNARRANFLAMRNLIAGARARDDKLMHERLANEMTDACNGKGYSVKKKDEMHRIAESNKVHSPHKW